MIIESEGSGDEYKDEDGPESESESEVDEQEEPKPTNIKGRKSGHTERSLLSPPNPSRVRSDTQTLLGLTRTVLGLFLAEVSAKLKYPV